MPNVGPCQYHSCILSAKPSQNGNRLMGKTKLVNYCSCGSSSCKFTKHTCTYIDIVHPALHLLVDVDISVYYVYLCINYYNLAYLVAHLICSAK